MFAWTASLGWIAVLLLVATVSIPYLVRAAPAAGTPRWRWMTVHFWIGPIVFLVAFIHAWLPMSADVARQGLAGIRLATFALLVMGWQVASGLQLRGSEAARRGSRRRRHFWSMTAIVVLVLAHIAINRVP